MTQNKKPPRDDDPDFFWTVLALSDLLDVSIKTIYDACERGQIPGAFRIGRTIRIHRKMFLDHIANNPQTPWIKRETDEP